MSTVDLVVQIKANDPPRLDVIARRKQGYIMKIVGV